MARLIVAGEARGPVQAADEGLSFWGGVDPATGRVIDAHHPWHGQSLAGKIVVMPTSRGSCTGSGVLLELILKGHAPAALVFREAEDILTLGAMVAAKLFGLVVPVVQVDADEFAALSTASTAEIVRGPSPSAAGDTLTAAGTATDVTLPLTPLGVADLPLTAADRALLAGGQGEAAKLAMEIVLDMAALQGAQDLVSVTRVHIDGCIYASPANLVFAEKIAGMGARVTVPTTMNAISVDHDNWRCQGVPADFGGPASRLADAYVQMGARASFTCAPYLLKGPPEAGEMIGWSESNAVIYANSVLAARTVKHPDFFDLFLALTGRAPRSGVYLDAQRIARRVIHITRPCGHDDAFWPLLGWLVGRLAPDRIPLLLGLEDENPNDAQPSDAQPRDAKPRDAEPSEDDLKALCAAFGTTSAAPMLHIAGVTPEGAIPPSPDADHVALTKADFQAAWQQFNSGLGNSGPETIDLVAIGSPHASLCECRRFADQLDGRPVSVVTIVTLGRDVLAAAAAEGTLARLKAAGVQVFPDLCWCSISEPVFPPSAEVLMTNSGKYAHYAPGLSGRVVRFGSLGACAEAAISGRARAALPDWLMD